jgi:hypothetical protein
MELDFESNKDVVNDSVCQKRSLRSFIEMNMVRVVFFSTTGNVIREIYVNYHDHFPILKYLL